LARGRTSAPARNADVFINCPFDDDYRPCFEAILFTVVTTGYRPRCALEENDAGDIRFDKLRKLIAESNYSIHDLSRTESGAEGLPRFNMPFELGFMMGAKHFGGPKQRAKRACIMVAKDYVLPKYLSDLAGNDPAAHGGDPREVIRIVRDHFHRDPVGGRLPGAAHLVSLLGFFHDELPGLAKSARLTMDEVHPRRSYKNFMEMLIAFRDIAHAKRSK
jgi:hypothetical protein